VSSHRGKEKRRRSKLRSKGGRVGNSWERLVCLLRTLPPLPPGGLLLHRTGEQISEIAPQTTFFLQMKRKPASMVCLLGRSAAGLWAGWGSRRSHLRPMAIRAKADT